MKKKTLGSTIQEKDTASLTPGQRYPLPANPGRFHSVKHMLRRQGNSELLYRRFSHQATSFDPFNLGFLFHFLLRATSTTRLLQQHKMKDILTGLQKEGL